MAVNVEGLLGTAINQRMDVTFLTAIGCWGEQKSLIVSPIAGGCRKVQLHYLLSDNTERSLVVTPIGGSTGFDVNVPFTAAENTTTWAIAQNIGNKWLIELSTQLEYHLTAGIPVATAYTFAIPVALCVKAGRMKGGVRYRLDTREKKQR